MPLPLLRGLAAGWSAHIPSLPHPSIQPKQRDGGKRDGERAGLTSQGDPSLVTSPLGPTKQRRHARTHDGTMARWAPRRWSSTTRQRRRKNPQQAAGQQQRGPSVCRRC